MTERVAILGASDKAERYSNQALNLLAQYGHVPIPVHPRLKEISGFQVIADLQALVANATSIDTVTMYVAPQISSALVDQLVALKPKRVIFNPGSENPAIYQSLKSAGIMVQEACTLVLLKTGQY